MISVENLKFFLLCVFCTPADRVPLGIGYMCKGSKTRMMELPDDPKSFKIGLAV